MATDTMKLIKVIVKKGSIQLGKNAEEVAVPGDIIELSIADVERLERKGLVQRTEHMQAIPLKVSEKDLRELVLSSRSGLFAVNSQGQVSESFLGTGSWFHANYDESLLSSFVSKDLKKSFEDRAVSQAQDSITRNGRVHGWIVSFF